MSCFPSVPYNLHLRIPSQSHHASNINSLYSITSKNYHKNKYSAHAWKQSSNTTKGLLNYRLIYSNIDANIVSSNKLTSSDSRRKPPTFSSQRSPHIMQVQVQRFALPLPKNLPFFLILLQRTNFHVATPRTVLMDNSCIFKRPRIDSIATIVDVPILN